MTQLSEKKELWDYYQSRGIAEKYTKSRFKSPLGSVYHKKQIEFINKSIKENSIKRVLEIGCGPARITQAIKNFEEGYAIDSSPAMLEIAKQKTKKWTFFLMDAFKLNFKKRFDLIFTLRLVRHFKKKGREEFYSHIKQKLDSGSYFLFDAVNYSKAYKVRKRSGFHKYPIYDKLYKKEELVKELEENGFKVVSLRGLHNHFYITWAISKITELFRLRKLGELLIYLLEKKESKNPLEWIVLCQKK